MLITLTGRVRFFWVLSYLGCSPSCVSFSFVLCTALLLLRCSRPGDHKGSTHSQGCCLTLNDEICAHQYFLVGKKNLYNWNVIYFLHQQPLLFHFQHSMNVKYLLLRTLHTLLVTAQTIIMCQFTLYQKKEEKICSLRANNFRESIF